MEKEIFFRAELQKKGKNFVVKVPDNFIAGLGLNAGDIASITMAKAEKVKLPSALAKVYRKHMPALKGLSDEQVSLVVDTLNREKVSSAKKAEAGLEKKAGKEMLSLYKKAKKQIAKADKKSMQADLEAEAKQLA
ncbi:MAG: hypothetical protein QME12_08610 [Nanoarchaeota archaeon]|nr:hypothetical protein [Nanoarchaeota archaeon]